ncbi:MAG: hypothetical protein GEV08_06205 [Acidimicrobiia bacterium]|nr:hypothetical protein [Acidimicrobiia bacterium]
MTGQLSLARRGERWAPAGVMHCGRVWACPVCAARVGQRRAEELAGAVSGWQAEGGTVLLVTYTVAHGPGDALDDLMGTVAKARRLMSGRCEWRALRAEVGWEGDVGNWEVTWGAWHGWHPHRHHLGFARPPRSWFGGREFICWWRRFEDLWASCVAAVSPQYRPGDGGRLGVGLRVDVVGEGQAESAAGYVMKDLAHGAAMEVARPEAKSSRAGRRSPWELLERAVDGWEQERDLWWEYSAAVKGRHRVQWSRGLRERLGVQVRTDEEIANDDGDADEVKGLDDDETALLLAVDEVTPYVCKAAERAGPDGAHAFMAMLLATLTSLERAELRLWAKARVDMAGKMTPTRRLDAGRDPPREGSTLWGSDPGDEHDKARARPPAMAVTARRLVRGTAMWAS